ncbi:family 16 glycosylhydrolase [Abyssalbus ytuae]|uniref:Family 16 glycosylhydrolase n=1 Tax=Abyssalbus ytuae TaxID=2926907 RepID=A0A9E6ZM37_9FLAO|nr:family 16 glycosylhydrolase [Abyssalbus ytuae]UOB16790.1 family 16 glycosylhydrolase [Abyssalbus ytuae]
MIKKFFNKAILFMFIIGSAMVHTGYSQCSELIFEDDFTGSSVDLQKWEFDNGDGCPTLCGWGNAEEQYYRAENTTIENGNLVITTKYENFGGKAYTSSKLVSTDTYNSKFGRYEASIKLPSAGGIWPAFWLLPENGNWPNTGEIDIMEAQHKNPHSVGGTVHYYNGGHQFNGREYNAGLDLSEGFHEYAIEWEPDEIRWYVDDTLYHTVTRANTVDPWPFDEGEWYIILNVAVGGTGTPYTGYVSPTPADYPTQMLVDYVRVYSGTFNTQISGDNKVYQGETGKVYNITPIDGASYNWSVPAGASIVSGQGTNSVTINWGNTGGDVKAVVSVPGCGDNEFKMSVSVNTPKTLEFIFEDFENNRNISYSDKTDGTLTQSINNPGPNTVNNSSVTGQYIRATGAQYDGLYMLSQNIGNALEYVSGEKSVWLDVYSDAPIGTEFMLQIENSTLSSGDWPAGRHSRYSARTTTQNQWETLEFELVDRPDTGVGALDVDQFVLLIQPDSYTGHTVYIDNLRKMDAPDAVLLDEVMIADFDGTNNLTLFFENGEFSADVANPSPNSVNNSANVGQYIRGSFELYDVVSFSTNIIENTGPFIEGDNIFYMDIYTSAPVGTEISLSLENQVASSNDYPSGRNSQYTSVVKEQNAWHTIAFTYASSPDGATSNLSVDEISILFNPNSNTSETYYFDNFRYGVTKLPPVYEFSAMIQDYDGTNNLSLNSTTTGVYNANISNPSANSVNSSANVAQYLRDNTELYDVLFFNTSYITDASAYVAGEKRFAMDVYTSAPAGTIISWQLEAGSVSTPENYPAGRHSIYQAAVKEQNTWHTLEFVLVSTPDLVVSDDQIDNVVLLFDPGKESGDTFYIDNLRILNKQTEQEEPVLTSINVTPLSSSIQAGQSQQFSAQGYDQFGNAINVDYTWSATGGNIDQNGLFTSSSDGSFTVTSSNGEISGSAQIIVNTVTNASPLPGKIEAEDYKDGGEGTGYHDVDAGNTGGAYKNDDVDIEVTGDESGDYNVGWIEAGEWLAYDINATATSQTYDIEFRIASPSGDGSFHLELDGASVTDVINVTATGGWQSYTTVTVNNIYINSGLHELRIVFDSSGLNLNYIEFSEHTDANGGEDDSCSGIAENGHYSYSISSDTDNPTITFIPEISGTGDSVCILYYGTSATGPYPGYMVTPNVPYQINAVQGEQVYFYYTYSLASGGENNTAATPHTFIVGNCGNTKSSLSSKTVNPQEPVNVVIHPNPVEDKLNIYANNGFDNFRLYNLSGKLIKTGKLSGNQPLIQLDFTNYEKGVYILKLFNNQHQTEITKRILKK